MNYFYAVLCSFMLGFYTCALWLFPYTVDGHNYREKVEKTYQCEKIDKGRYIEVDGKKKCVISIDVAPSK